MLDSLKRKFRARSLRNKLFVLLILISLFPTLIVSFLSQLFFLRSGTEYASAISSQLIDYMSGEINGYLADINGNLDTLAIDFEFQKYLSVPADNIPGQAQYAINFRPLLQLIIQSKKEIVGALYLDQFGKVYSESKTGHRLFDYSFRADDRYGGIYDMTQEGFIPPHPLAYMLPPDSNRQVVTFVKPVIDLRSNAVYAWLSIEIDAAWLQGLMDHTQLGRSGLVMLYNETSGELFQFGEDEAVTEALRQSLAEGRLSSEKYTQTVDGITYQILSSPIPLANWTLVGAAPLNELTRGVEQARLITAIVAAVSLIVALIVAYPFMGMVLRPLQRLKAGMQMLGHGTSVPIRQTAYDEFGFLIRTYNKMLDDLNRMREEVIQSKLSEKEKELLQLQAQINPHFLFNTLETIESYSLHNNGEAVSDMLRCVSRMMRYNVRGDGGKAPLKEEIKYTQDFLNIHSYRYGKRVNAQFAVAPELLEMPVMKLSIQPLVENALKYGWSPTAGNDDFLIRVSVELDNGRVLFEVADNGRGMSDDVFELLSNLGDGEDRSGDPFFRQHTGILNIYRRYALAYGSDFAMTVLRGTEDGRGTRISIRVPMPASSLPGRV
ncbi:cache domain-containing sensor histidine kinase [Cohnella cellulosilytica]|uniref:Sensor histidine kinase n=1 Tax=Cohnella cellulosilytica TaxID=986710 RepID=A0ABW2F725_9BACL